MPAGPLDRDRFVQAEALFHELIDLPEEERSAELARRCAEDPDLLILVTRLFAEDAGAAADELRTPGERAAAAQPATAEALPERIGRFEIVRKLGEGGMGKVYEALQEVPRRSVALKVIRPEITDAESHQRFQQEVQLLGRLKHPGIAQIYEAGTTGTDRGDVRYFAMELVDGPNVLQYVRERDLGQRDRLLLMARICEAVHFAHSQGVIHRDIKPSNILVESAPAVPDNGEGAQPKILDFGVAFSSDDRDLASGVLTRTGQMVGTLAYMSPEQVAEERVDLDARADVYSLGVVLYEVLTGRRPYDLENLSLFEAARLIRTGDTATVGACDRSLRGDVDTIVAKAMAKDRADRYASAAELARDIRRHLAGDPITARPAGPVLRARKFVRRRRELVIGVLATVLVFTIFFGFREVIGPGASLEEEDRGPTGATQREELLASRWTANAEAYAYFLNGFVLIRSYRSPTDPEEAKQWFNKALAIDPDYAPALAGLALTLQWESTYNGHLSPGGFEEAKVLTRRAHEIDPDLSLAYLADATGIEIEGRIQEAATHARKAIELNPRLGDAYVSLARVQYRLGDWPSAIATARQGIAADPEWGHLYSALSFILYQQGEHIQAAQVLEEGLARLPHDPTLLIDYSNSLRRQQRYDEAAAKLLECLDAVPDCATCARMLGVTHQAAGRPAVADSIFADAADRWSESSAVMLFIARHHGERGRLADQEALLRHAIELDAYNFDACHELAVCIARQGRPDEAETFLLDAMERWPGECRTSGYIANFYLNALGRVDDAEAWCKRAIAECPDWPRFYLGLGRIYEGQEQYELAVGEYERAIALWPGSAYEALRAMSHALRQLRRFADAVDAAERAVAENPSDKWGQFQLGWSRLFLRQPSHAVVAFEAALELDRNWLEAFRSLSVAYEHSGRFEKSLEMCTRATDIDSTVTWIWHRKAHVALTYLRDYEMAEAAAWQLVHRKTGVQTKADGWMILGLCARLTDREEDAKARFQRAAEIIDAALADDPDKREILPTAALAWARVGRAEEARLAAERIGPVYPKDREFLYDMGRALALIGDGPQAVAMLEEAVAAGFANWERMRHDVDLDGLRGRPEFEALQNSLIP